MKYCNQCGKELVDEAVMCPNCGCAVQAPVNQQEDKPSTGLNILAFLFPLVGLVLPEDDAGARQSDRQMGAGRLRCRCCTLDSERGSGRDSGCHVRINARVRVKCNRCISPAFFTVAVSAVTCVRTEMFDSADFFRYAGHITV